MSNNANRFVTIQARRRMAADECTRVRACNKVGGAGKHLLKAARQAARTGAQIKFAVGVAEQARLKKDHSNDIPFGFSAVTFPYVARMYRENGYMMAANFLRNPRRGVWSPWNDVSDLEEFLKIHGDRPWWKIPKDAWRGRIWYLKNVRSSIGATPKFWEKLGKVSHMARWGAISIGDGKTIEGSKDRRCKLPWSHRDLNWEAAAQAGRGPRTAIGFIPEWRKNVVWAWRFPCIDERLWPENVWPWMFGPSFTEIINRAMKSDEWLDKRSQIDAACRIYLWLGDLDMAEALWRRLGMEIWQEGFTSRHLHDLAQRFPLRRPAKWWRQIVMAAPAQSRPYLRVSEAVESAVKAGEAIPKSMADLRALCARCGIMVPSAGDLTAVEEDFISTTAPKSWEEVPSIDEMIDGIHLTKVAANDPLALIAGRLVNCCQHLEGAAASAAAECWTNPAVGVYVAKKGDMVVGQAMVWRGAVGWDGEESGTLVLDSIECLSGHEAAVAKAFVSAAPLMLHRGLGVRKIVVGNTDYGCTELVHKHCGSVQHPPAQPYDGYTDAHRVRPLIKLTKKGEIKRYG